MGCLHCIAVAFQWFKPSHIKEVATAYFEGDVHGPHAAIWHVEKDEVNVLSNFDDLIRMAAL